MPIPLAIAYDDGLPPTEALRRQVERAALKLDRFSDRIAARRIAVKKRPGRDRQGELIAVKLTLGVLGERDVIVDCYPSAGHTRQDPYVAIREAFNTACRRLRDRERGRLRRRKALLDGWVDRIAHEDGFGFIETSDGREIYFHRDAVLDGSFDRLRTGSAVCFTEGSQRGSEASTVRIVRGRDSRQNALVTALGASQAIVGRQ
jgi:cold shock CspA family protein